MKAEIIAVGTELLMGQIVNTNAKYLSEQLALLGIDLYVQTVVGDNMQRLQEAFRLASERSDLIVCTGGLGPTQDDLTKQALGDFLGRKLVLDPTSMAHIERFFESRGVVMVQSNERQALILEGSDALVNETGLAAGVALSVAGVHYILLPGPPREMKPMFEQEAVKWLRERSDLAQPLYSKIVKFAGIGESTLEHEIIDLIHNQQDPTIAPYAKEGEVTIRITTRAASQEQADQKIAPVLDQLRLRFPTHLFAEEEISLESAVVGLLLQKGLTLSAAESCTGGLFAEMVTSVPGSSGAFAGSMVTYSNEMKHRWLDIPMELLEGEHAPGAVSRETAEKMAEHMLMRAGTDFSIAITGVAGPAHSENKPVGLVYIAVAQQSKPTYVEECRFSGGREIIRLRSARHVLYHLWQRLSRM